MDIKPTDMFREYPGSLYSPQTPSTLSSILYHFDESTVDLVRVGETRSPSLDLEVDEPVRIILAGQSERGITEGHLVGSLCDDHIVELTKLSGLVRFFEFRRAITGGGYSPILKSMVKYAIMLREL
jgi:hypothetical protein